MNTLIDSAEAIVFDLGEVIIDLEPQAVIRALREKAAHLSEAYILELIVSANELYLYETGKMTTSQFITYINKKLDIELDTNEFSRIWNSMLRDIDPAKIDLLKELKKSRKTLFLSNTNATHEVGFNQMARERFGLASLGELVEKPIYSHDIGIRKPEQEIYHLLIKEADVPSHKIVFFDDKKENIDAAKQLGINAILLEKSNKLLTYFE